MSMEIRSLLNSFDVPKGLSIASAAAITAREGVFFDVTGTTNINHIRKPVHGKRSRLLILRFNGSLTVGHNAGSVPTGFAAMKLVGAANVSATAADVMIFVYDGTAWQQIAPTLVG